MALELLYEGAVQRNTVDCHALHTPAWVDGLGYVGVWLIGGTSGSWCYGAAQLDGEVVLIDSIVYYQASYSLDYKEDGLLVSYNGLSRWTAEPFTNIQAWLQDYPNNPSISGYDIRLPDRYLKGVNAQIQTAALDGSTGWSTETSFTPENQSGSYFSSWGYMSSAGGGNYWFCSRAGGIALYDAQNQVILESYKVAPIPTGYSMACMHYSLDLDVFIGVYNNNSSSNDAKIRVYSTETRPYSLSNPVALSTLQRGTVTTMEVQLLGEHGDFVRDFPIDWTLTSGDGQLSDSQSLTDNEGKAQIDYIPDNLASGGFTLQAEAQY